MAYWTPDIFIQLFHPHCVQLFTSSVMSPSLCRALPRYLNSVTFGRWAVFVLTLPPGFPFRQIYSVFAFDTSILLFFKASLHCSNPISITYVSLANRILGEDQRPLQTVRLFLKHISLQFRTDGACPSPVLYTSVSPACLPCINTVLTYGQCRIRLQDQ